MLRLVQSLEEVDISITVAQAARVIGCDRSTVYELIDSRQLRGNRVGKGRRGKAPRGVRVSLASAEAYKRRHAIGGEEGEPMPAPTATTAGNAAHRAAVERLKARGIV